MEIHFERRKVMLNKRRFCLKWTSILIAYLCIFLLSYEFGATKRDVFDGNTTTEPRHLLIKRLFSDHSEYLNSSVILQMIEMELGQRLYFDTEDQNSKNRHGLVVFYDYVYHHVYFQQLLWLYSSWIQLPDHAQIQNDLILFISSPSIPDDFQKLLNLTNNPHRRNQLLIYPCQTLIDSILNKNYEFLDHFPAQFHMELARFFYWQQTHLSSLLLFLHHDSQKKLSSYDYIFRLDIDSFLMSKFSFYHQKLPFILGQSISHDLYTLNRLKRIKNSFHSQSIHSISRQSLSISWFGKLDLLVHLTRQILLMTVWLIKEEFTESERLHHLTYLNYPSWYIDGIFEYATALILSLHQYEPRRISPFDCQHLLTHCLHLSLRDPSHHLHLSKHSLQLLTNISSSNLTANELYLYRTVIKSNGIFRLNFQ